MQATSIQATTFQKSLYEHLSGIPAWFRSDARHYQVFFLSIFLLYGITFLQWDIEPAIAGAAFTGCLITQSLFIVAGMSNLQSIKSALISSLSLCLMLRANEPVVMLLAATLSISGKFLLRWWHPSFGKSGGGWKHIFNPTNFGIIVTILISGDAWISPGQWGSHGFLLFGIGLLGLLVLLKVKRLDIAFTFFIVFYLLSFMRNVMVLGWSADVFFHQFTSGTLLLFTFFMITDPVSTPSHHLARICWATLVALLAFYLSAYEFVNGAPVWALFFLSPLTLLFDKLFLHSKFNWL